MSIERGLALIVLVAAALVGCGRDRALARDPGPTAGGVATAASAPATSAAGVGARARGTAGPDAAAAFDGERALARVVALVERGQRWAGAPRRGDAIAALEADLAAVCDRVERQSFRSRASGYDAELELVNLVGRLRPEAPRRVLLATHWDTRGRSDRDPDAARRALPVPGANDGASGVAVLLELLRVLGADRSALPGLGIDVAFFDGEELVVEGDPPCCPGSRHFAETAPSLYGERLPIAALVLDLVGDRDLALRREALSQRRARPLVDLVWSAGRRRAPAVFLDALQPPVIDDHAALLAIGVPAALIIDLDYDAWHTQADLPERIGARSLGLIGAVLLDALAELERRDLGAKPA